MVPRTVMITTREDSNTPREVPTLETAINTEKLECSTLVVGISS